MASNSAMPVNNARKGVKIYDRPPERPMWVFPVALALLVLLWYVVWQTNRSHAAPPAAAQTAQRAVPGNTALPPPASPR